MGGLVLFDRSWYNRAGVERVLDFCTAAQYLELMRSWRFVLSRFDYPEKDSSVVGRPDKLIVGRAKALREVDESPRQLFPRL